MLSEFKVDGTSGQPETGELETGEVQSIVEALRLTVVSQSRCREKTTPTESGRGLKEGVVRELGREPL